MANEYLKRTPTSTGNRKVWTWSYWIKKNALGGQVTFYTTQASTPYLAVLEFQEDNRLMVTRNENATVTELFTTNTFRDVGNWMHLIVVFNTTSSTQTDRVKLYVNGVLQSSFTGTYPSINYEGGVNRMVEHDIGTVVTPGYPFGYPGTFLECEVADVFFIDGQALTPDVFGFNKVGKGYISVGSTQSTDFRPGQWVPKTPRVIKTAINNNGGFGVNGFYLPMNDSNNFGADFHCDPNSIITLNEKLPQPRVGVATTASVGLGYTDALRADPYAANLVLAIPGVIGGQSSGYGDYSANIKGSGSNKTVTANGNAGVAATASYYGSALSFDGTGDYFASANSSDFYFNGDFTVEFWVYRNVTSTSETLVGVFENSVARRSWQIETRTNSALKFEWFSDGSSSSNITTANNSVPGSQWNHIAMVKKNNTITGYVNGVAAGINTTAGAIYQNTVDPLRIGVLNAAEDQDFSGYLQDLRIYKGVAKYTGGFDVPRPYTPVGIATWRAVPDTTANNFATLNPLVPSVFSSGDRSISNGNLTVTTISTGNGTNARSTIGMSSGKWYAETYVNGIYGFLAVLGIGRTDNQTNASSGDHINYYGSNGQKYDYDNGSPTISSYGSTYTTGDIIGISINGDNGEVVFYKNGVSQGVAKTFTTSQYPLFFQMEDGASAATVTYNMNFGQNPTFSGNTTAGTFTDSNNKGLFKYQPPSGFLALCEDNLPTPAISDPGKYFKTVLYTGDGNSGRSIVGVGFTPDLVWVKLRNTTGNHSLYDAVRGAGQRLSSSLTNAEATFTNSITSFDSTGFSLGSNSDGDVNSSGNTYVAWCWKAGAGTTSTNTNGSITSVVSVNQDAGFSIVSGSSGGSGASSYDSYGHGLGKTPSFILVKNRDTVDYFYAYHKSLSTGSYLILGATNASVGAGSSVWGTSGVPTSSVITVRQASFASAANQRLIFYCWAEIEGFSKFGSYTGNGSADGPFVYCGFRPAWVMIKRTDSTQNWPIIDSSRDSVNVANRRLFANLTDIEDQGIPNFVDILSNGFKCRDSNVSYNASGGTYIFVAYAESPFQTANAK